MGHRTRLDQVDELGGEGRHARHNARRPRIRPGVGGAASDRPDGRGPGAGRLLGFAARVAPAPALDHRERDDPLAAVAVGDAHLERSGRPRGQRLEVGLADLVADRRLADLDARERRRCTRGRATARASRTAGRPGRRTRAPRRPTSRRAGRGCAPTAAALRWGRTDDRRYASTPRPVRGAAGGRSAPPAARGSRSRRRAGRWCRRGRSARWAGTAAARRRRPRGRPTPARRTAAEAGPPGSPRGRRGGRPAGRSRRGSRAGDRCGGRRARRAGGSGRDVHRPPGTRGSARHRRPTGRYDWVAAVRPHGPFCSTDTQNRAGAAVP